MKISTLSASRNRVFIPSFCNNKDAPVGDQIKVHYKAPTIAMKEKLFPRQIDIINEKPQISILIKRDQVIKEMVTSIENLTYSDDAVGDEDIKVATVDQLFKAPIEFEELVEEIYVFLNECINTRVSEKN
jgi:hypothetical protein